MTDEEFLRLWKTGPRGEREVNEFEKAGLLPDTEAVKETVEIGLSFERAGRDLEEKAKGRGLVRGLPEVRGSAVQVPTRSVLPEKK